MLGTNELATFGMGNVTNHLELRSSMVVNASSAAR
jgi:hypothetical protein